MKLQDRQDFLKLFFSGCLSITQKKGKDYNPTGVPFLEVLETAVEGGMTPTQVLFVYYRKHASAIRAYLEKGHLESEPILGRLQDAANYMGMIAFYDANAIDLHEAWRQYWVVQPCECEYGEDLGMENVVTLCCLRCRTLSWLEGAAFKIGSKGSSSDSIRRAQASFRTARQRIGATTPPPPLRSVSVTPKGTKRGSGKGSIPVPVVFSRGLGPKKKR